jgi:transcriptional regulator with XRE-family HTH domain
MTLDNGKSKPRLTAPKKKEQPPPSPHHIQGVFGWNMKQRRLERGLTQEQLAERACTSVDTIKRYESGNYDGVRLDMACYIAGALGVPLQTLLPQQERSPEQLLCEAEALIHTARELCKTK